jgi:arylsulfatase
LAPGSPSAAAEDRRSPSCSSHWLRDGQFGKNHLGDLKQFLPRVHGFDEFFGNLYHLNAEEDRKTRTIRPRRSSRSSEAFDPRRVHSWDRPKTTTDEEPRWGRVGKQKIEDTGHSDEKRMETIDDETTGRARISSSANTRRQAVLRLDEHHAHARVSLTPSRESVGQAGRWQSPYHDTMIDHDKNVGELLDLVDELGLADNTIIMYSTDNGPHMNTWPDGADDAIPEREELQLGGALPHSSARALAGQDSGRRRGQRHRPASRLAADVPGGGRRAGHRREAEEGAQGRRQDVQSAHRRLQPAAVPDQEGERSPRKGSSTSATTATVGVRFDNWKVVFMEQRCRGRWRLGRAVRAAAAPKLFNLRTDPFERADITSNTYWDWSSQRIIVLTASQVVGEFLKTFKDFPPRQKAASFTIDQAMEKMESVGSGANH